MVHIVPNRLRSVTEARNTFNALLDDAENGVTTHVMKGARVVAHIVPNGVPVLDDARLQAEMMDAFLTQEASAVADSGWCGGESVPMSGDLCRLLIWTWRTDLVMFETAVGQFRKCVEDVAGRAFSVEEIVGGMKQAGGVPLDGGDLTGISRFLQR